MQEMKTSNFKIPAAFLLCILFLSLSCCTGAQALAQSHESFLRCLLSHNTDNSIFEVIYTPKNTSYNSILISNIQNQRFVSPARPKPSVIVTPRRYAHVQSVVSCARIHKLQIRTRCGGHDYEGLSYISYYLDPFVIVDLRNFKSISVDTKTRTAWVEGGARIGELYYSIAEKSPNLGFPAGTCPTVGVGGHISGGGEGPLKRKYGLASDNVIDAKIVDANGEILDRKSMGEDLCWAIRGGGGASFGIILAYKLNLVYVPSTVTVFTPRRTLAQNATKLVHQWQSIAPQLDKDLFIRVILGQARENGRVTIQAAFNSLFLGRVDELLSLMQKSFPELGLRREDCTELSWIEAALYFSDLPSGSTINDLARSEPYPKNYYKNKADYVVDPIPEVDLERLWKILEEEVAERGQLIFAPYGGIMSEIPESETPYPHRAGYLYQIQHITYWFEEDNAKSQIYIDWIRSLYAYMTPFVTKSPRAAYLNYRDLDLGVNKDRNTSFAQASEWGFKYFGNNFYRLARVKKMVDPNNFFRYEQSIPPLN